jgi:hypothetical protein
MEEGQNIEQSQEERKSESQQEVNKNISQKQTIEQLQTKYMEVHHHPDLHHRKKHFKEYFLEFLMIFLAVTLGFFAESYREYLGDRSNEKKFMNSMVEDLKSDTTTINGELYYAHVTDANTDSLLFILKQGSNPKNIKLLYKFVGNDFYRFNNFKYHNRTVEELKSSGNFRLIQNRFISDSIMSYDNNMKYFLYMLEGLQNMMFSFKAAEQKVLDYKNFNAGNYLKDFTISVNDSVAALLTPDKLLLGQYYNNLFNYSLLSSLHAKLLNDLKLEAIDFLLLINKQYNLNE